MEKHFYKVLTLLCFLVSGVSQAQNTFAPVGAEWYYGGNNYDYSFWPAFLINTTWSDHVSVTGDTTVAGIACRKLELTHTQRDGYHAADSVTYRDTFFVYDNTDTVFFYNRHRAAFIPIYVFNVEEGDTVRLPNPFNANGTYSYVVDSVGAELYDTAHLRTIYTRGLIPPGNYAIDWGKAYYQPDEQKWLSRGKYTEKLGGTWPLIGGLFPSASFLNPDGGVLIHAATGDLRCYQDAFYNLKMTNWACDSIPMPLLGISSIKGSAAGIHVFPNPSSGNFSVLIDKVFPRDMKITLIDLSGRKLETGTIAAGKATKELTFGHIGNGIYFLLFEVAGEQYYQKIVIQH